MKHKAYLFIFPAILVFLGASWANMHSSETNDNKAPALNTENVGKNPQPIETSDRGKLLYENHCQGCHSVNIHSRNSDKVNSIHDIRQWVIRWSRNLELGWQENDIDLVTDFLNQQFYHFPN